MKFTKEYRKIWNAQYYLKNKERISKEHKEYHEKNKEKQILSYRWDLGDLKELFDVPWTTSLFPEEIAIRKRKT